MPHHHHDELSDAQNFTEHSTANSALDFLGVIFHENIGEGHLENFENTEFDFNFSLSNFMLVSYPSFIAESEEVHNYFYVNQRIPLPISAYQKATSKRGPPVV